MVLIKSKYKVVSKLNKNIWNDNAKLLSFNKNKWSKLKSNIKRDSFLNSQIPWYKLNQQKNNAKQNYSLGISNNYPLYENESDYYLKKSNLRFFKTNFFNDIQFRLSHGLLTKGQLNKIILKAKNKKKTILFNDLKEKMLLQKLDYSLWSLNLVKSIFEVKQLISHKHVYVNGKVLNMNMYNIKNNDTISLDYSFSSLINMNSYLYKVNSFFYYKNFNNIPSLPSLNSFENCYWLDILLRESKQKSRLFPLFSDPRK